VAAAASASPRARTRSPTSDPPRGQSQLPQRVGEPTRTPAGGEPLPERRRREVAAPFDAARGMRQVLAQGVAPLAPRVDHLGDDLPGRRARRRLQELGLVRRDFLVHLPQLACEGRLAGLGGRPLRGPARERLGDALLDQRGRHHLRADRLDDEPIQVGHRQPGIVRADEGPARHGLIAAVVLRAVAAPMVALERGERETRSSAGGASLQGPRAIARSRSAFHHRSTTTPSILLFTIAEKAAGSSSGL
jgi:hypothetical protein